MLLPSHGSDHHSQTARLMFCSCKLVPKKQSHNKSFCLVTCGDNVLTQYLPNEVRNLGIKLPSQYFKYFDIRSEFKKFYYQADAVRTS